MYAITKIISLSLLFILLISGTKDATTSFSFSKNEIVLFDSINSYRVKNGLPKIPLSLKLSKVAQIHCEDLEKNYKPGTSCNLHSWSKGSTKWKSCCYTSNHSQAECMWNKPRELTGYNSEGYEIAYCNSKNCTPFADIEAWKTSKTGHNEVIINTGIWSSVRGMQLVLASRSTMLVCGLEPYPIHPKSL